MPPSLALILVFALSYRPMASRTNVLAMLRQGHLCDINGKSAESINQIQNCMEDLEQCYAVLSLWLWLSHRLGGRGQFPGQSAASEELRLVQVDSGKNINVQNQQN